MKRLTSKLAQIKACFLAFVTTRLFYLERTKESVNLSIWMYKIKRRTPLLHDVENKPYKEVEAFYFRRRFFEKERNYAYIEMSFFHYFRISIDLHRPI
jgi:hypothetical protein